MAERSAHERATLIFPTGEEAARWREGMAEKLESAQAERLRRGLGEAREVVGQELERQFALHGEAAGGLRTPWEHTPAEHQEVQTLVDAAFAKDLPAALRQARASAHYPRNLDLLHDVLTGEMYRLLLEHKLNQQPTAALAAITLLLIIAVLCLSFWLLLL